MKTSKITPKSLSSKHSDPIRSHLQCINCSELRREKKPQEEKESQPQSGSEFTVNSVTSSVF